MRRIYQSEYSNFQNHRDLINQTAFHEAGHAAAIHFGNNQKQLPPVFFKIQLKQSTNEGKQFCAKVIDGCLIQNLPIAGLNNIYELSTTDQLKYQSAYEADVINLLVGPLAEAKFVSERDDEIFNFNLLNIHSLNYYGGTSDIEKAYAYLEYFIPSKEQRENKMLELFNQAFQFIEDDKIWNGILKLAQYILNSKKDQLSCEEIIEVLTSV